MSTTGPGHDRSADGAGGDDLHGHGAGAYVLGALSPSEDERFEEHLRSCPRCRREVDELSGLPRLLARVPGDVVAGLGDVPDAPRRAQAPPTADPLPEPPARMLDGVLRRASELRRRRRRKTGASAAVLVAAAVALVLLLGPGVPGPGGGPASPPPTATGPAARVEVPLAALTPGPLAVDARLDPVAWGTRIRLTCRYTASPGAGGAAYAAPSYALVVRSPSGDREQVATWQAVPGRTVHVEAATALPLARIAAVEVRAGGGDGPAVLRGRPWAPGPSGGASR